MPTDIEAADMIEEFGDTFTVTRRAAAVITNGIATAGAPSTLSIYAAIWPATGRELQRLPELRRSLETRAGVTSTQLLVGGQGASNEADLITIDGALWEVQSCGAFDVNAPDFFTFVVQRPNAG